MNYRRCAEARPETVKTRLRPFLPVKPLLQLTSRFNTAMNGGGRSHRRGGYCIGRGVFAGAGEPVAHAPRVPDAMVRVNSSAQQGSARDRCGRR